jgi:lysophospholipase L1-like esterase
VNAGTAQKRPVVEPILAAIVLAIPFLYLVSDHSRDVWLWRYSRGHWVLIGASGAAVLLFLASYRMALPGFLRATRRLSILLLGSCFAACIAGEAALRLVDDSPYAPGDNSGRHAPDPGVGHVYLPDFEQTISGREFRTPWRSNAQGLRAERDFGPKPAGVYRILVVGDSFTVGDQVLVEATYPGVLQRRFDAALGPGKVEVVNAGFPGYGTVNEARWIAKFGAAFEPDLVVVGMTPNDLLENQFPLQYTARDGAMVLAKSTDADRRVFEDRKRWYSLPGHVERSLLRERIVSSARFRRLRLGYVHTHRHAYMAQQGGRSRALYELAQKYLLEAQANALALGARFVLAVIPFREQLGELGDGLDAQVFGRRMAAFGEQHGFEVLDLLPAFRSHPAPESLYWRIDSHCTAAGYGLIGTRLHEFLAALGPSIGLP